MRAQRAPRIATAAAILLLAFACRGAQQVASTLEVGYSTGEGSLDGTYGRSSFDSESQAVWLSLHPLAFLEPPRKTLADPDLLAAIGRLQPLPAAVGSITVTTQDRAAERGSQALPGAREASSLQRPARVGLGGRRWGDARDGESCDRGRGHGGPGPARGRRDGCGQEETETQAMRRLLPLLFLLAGCPSLGQRMDPAAWEQELDLLTLDLQDAQDVAQDAQLKAALARASEVTSRVSDALERYQTLGGDNLELLLTIETALSELDQILASDPDNGDLRAGILLVKVALRRMAAYVKE